MDQPELEAGSPLLCPQCMRRTVYAVMQCWYICPVHGVVFTDENLMHYVQWAMMVGR